MVIYLFIGLFAFSRAAPGGYGGSQARGLIRAIVAGLHQGNNNTRSEPSLRPTPQLMATQMLNPLSEARDRTQVLMDASRVR